MPDKIGEYLAAAAEQIRWKRARPALTAELRTHLLDQRDACEAEGMDGESAVAEALRQMGDPVSVGAELDRVHRPKPQWGLLALVLALALAGGILRVWLTAEWRDSADPLETALALALGAAGLLGAYFLDYSFLGRHAKAVYAGALALGVLCLWLSPKLNHASYYTRYAALLYPTVYAFWLYAWRGHGRKGLLFSLAGGLPLAAVPLLAPYLLGAILLSLAAVVLLLLAARRDWFGIGRGRTAAAALGMALLPAGAAARVLKGRLLTALHPEADPLGSGYQGTMVREALSSAQWLGRGHLTAAYPGSSYEMLVPEAGRDFLPSTLIHRLGWMPFLLLVLAFAALFGWLLVRCLKQKNQLGRLVSMAVVLTLGLQSALSLTLNLGFVLFSVHFPLITGNLHTVLDMTLIGLALSVFRQESISAASAVTVPTAPSHPRIAWRDGELVIALRAKP